MDHRRDVRDFLVSRRARLTPEQAGLIASSRRRSRPKPTAAPRSAVLAILAGMTGIPAYVRNAQLDILAANDPGRPPSTTTPATRRPTYRPNAAD